VDPRATHRRLRAGAAWLLLALAAVAPQAAAQERAPPPPFAYVGTLDQGGERYAVLLARDQSVLLVRAGETINDEYRVRSIAGERLLLMNLASGTVQELALPLPGSSGVQAPPAAEPPREPSTPQEPAIDTPSSASAPPGEGARPGYAH
jgi:hypothetical protein